MKREFIRRTVRICILITMIIICTACTEVKEHLPTDQELDEYRKENFGDAKLLSSEYIDNKNNKNKSESTDDKCEEYIVNKYQDDQFGFEYKVRADRWYRSSVDKYFIDIYSPDFEEQYIEEILKTLNEEISNIENGYRCEVFSLYNKQKVNEHKLRDDYSTIYTDKNNINTVTTFIVYMIFQDNDIDDEDTVTAAELLSDTLNELDTRRIGECSGYLKSKNMSIGIFKNNLYVGCMNLTDKSMYFSS